MRGTCLDFSRLPWLSSRLKMKLLSPRPGTQISDRGTGSYSGSIDRADFHVPLTWLTMINMFLWAFWEFCDLDLCRTSSPYLCQEETVSQVVQTSKYYDQCGLETGVCYSWMFVRHLLKYSETIPDPCCWHMAQGHGGVLMVQANLSLSLSLLCIWHSW